MPDTVTGATPLNNFVLHTRTEPLKVQQFKVLFEINQSWDWNKYWTNYKFPGNEDYKSSCQPAVVYAATIHLADSQKHYPLKPIGHSHYAGENGKLYKDLSTITSALHIADSIWVEIE
jgi:hypothetical protein